MFAVLGRLRAVWGHAGTALGRSGFWLLGHLGAIGGDVRLRSGVRCALLFHGTTREREVGVRTGQLMEYPQRAPHGFFATSEVSIGEESKTPIFGEVPHFTVHLGRLSGISLSLSLSLYIYINI